MLWESRIRPKYAIMEIVERVMDENEIFGPTPVMTDRKIAAKARNPPDSAVMFASVGVATNADLDGGLRIFGVTGDSDVGDEIPNVTLLEGVRETAAMPDVGIGGGNKSSDNARDA